MEENNLKISLALYIRLELSFRIIELLVLEKKIFKVFLYYLGLAAIFVM